MVGWPRVSEVMATLRWTTRSEFLLRLSVFPIPAHPTRTALSENRTRSAADDGAKRRYGELPSPPHLPYNLPPRGLHGFLSDSAALGVQGALSFFIIRAILTTSKRTKTIIMGKIDGSQMPKRRILRTGHPMNFKYIFAMAAVLFSFLSGE